MLDVKDLRVRYGTPLGAVTAADGISFDLRVGERLGIVGESGSGKSTLALAILRMIKPPGRIDTGQVWLDGVDVLALSDEDMRQVRLARIALIPQGSMNSLNPVTRIKEQITEVDPKDVHERLNGGANGNGSGPTPVIVDVREQHEF